MTKSVIKICNFVHYFLSILWPIFTFTFCTIYGGSWGPKGNRAKFIISTVVFFYGLPKSSNGIVRNKCWHGYGSLKLFAIMLYYVAIYPLKSTKLHEISLLKMRRHLCLYKFSLICMWQQYWRQVLSCDDTYIWNSV